MTVTGGIAQELRERLAVALCDRDRQTSGPRGLLRIERLFDRWWWREGGGPNKNRGGRCFILDLEQPPKEVCVKFSKQVECKAVDSAVDVDTHMHPTVNNIQEG